MDNLQLNIMSLKPDHSDVCLYEFFMEIVPLNLALLMG